VKVEHTKQMILLFLETLSRPPAPVRYGRQSAAATPRRRSAAPSGELNTNGIVRRITMERDALYTIGGLK
jgi:hypothetical protein